MTDEKFINKFLEKTYYVKIDGVSINVCEKDSHNSFSWDVFMIYHFSTIFGNYKVDSERTSTDVVSYWFKQKQITLLNDLIKELDKINLEMGVKIGAADLLKSLLTKFKRKHTYSENFIITQFHQYYNEKILLPRLIEYIDSYKEGIFSKEFHDNFKNKLNLDTIKQHEYAKDFLYNWYSDQVIGDKVRDLFSEFVITMGPRNWIVTWIGQGILDKNKLLKYFKNESEEILEYIVTAYDKWYEEAVITASERIMFNNSIN